jgi:hypothetical protein
LENQAVCIWGIQLKDIEKADPPVVRGDSVEGNANREWETDFEHLSSFLLAMLYWQGVMGGMAVSAVVSGVEAQVENAIRANWKAVELGVNNTGFRVYQREGQVLCLAGNAPHLDLYVGARSEEDCLEIEKLLNVEWDYCSLDDD